MLPLPLISIQDCSITRDQRMVISSLWLQLLPGEHLAIVGPSGSGKTSLLLALQNKLHYHGKITMHANTEPLVFVGQIHQFKNKSNTADFYYQQRYHAIDAADSMTAQEWIGTDTHSIRHAMPGIDDLLEKPLVQLSNGEHKKIQLAKALTAQPKMLLLDQPFIGLDASSRQWLHEKLNALAASGITLIIVTSPSEIPACITLVLQLQNEGKFSFGEKEKWLPNIVAQTPHPLDRQDVRQMMLQLIRPSEYAFEEAIRLEDVSVAYGDKPILQHINWTVKRGERWLLQGPNGAGKTTLLSLITGDHPQAYSNKVFLFGKRRGSGESIWDIKKQIGFISPELQMYFLQTATCYHTVASGIFDTIGLFRTLPPADEARVQQWMHLFGLQKDQHKPFRSFSAGEQRLILLVRALIKNPPLLVLDEPCQGLDEQQQQVLLRWIDEICEAGKKTMVFITHYHQDKPNCIDKMLQLEKGIATIASL